MKTRSKDSEQVHGLPPPPAPTATDANPWPLSAAPKAERSSRHAHPPPGRRPAEVRPKGMRVRSSRRVRWMPLAILVFIAGLGVQAAIQALNSGDVEAAIGVLAVVALVAFVALRGLLRNKA